MEGGGEEWRELKERYVKEIRVRIARVRRDPFKEHMDSCTCCCCCNCWYSFPAVIAGTSGRRRIWVFHEVR